MHLVGPALAGVLALAIPTTAFAGPLAAKTGAVIPSPAPGVEKISGGCGRGWHPVPGHWSQWRGAWVSAALRAEPI